MSSPRNGIVTARERDVLALAGRGLTNQEIADDLFISARTVKCTLHRAGVRLGARNRTQAVILAMRQGALNILDMFSIDELAELLGSMPPEVVAAVSRRAGAGTPSGQIPSFMTDYVNDGQDTERNKGEVECGC